MNYHSRVYHFIIGLVLSSTLLIITPNSHNPEGISYAGLNVETLVISLILFILGICLGVWMCNLEEKYK